MLGKPAFNDVKEGIITAPLIYGLLDYNAKGDKQKFNLFNNIVLN